MVLLDRIELSTSPLPRELHIIIRKLIFNDKNNMRNGLERIWHRLRDSHQRLTATRLVRADKASCTALRTCARSQGSFSMDGLSNQNKTRKEPPAEAEGS